MHRAPWPSTCHLEPWGLASALAPPLLVPPPPEERALPPLPERPLQEASSSLEGLHARVAGSGTHGAEVLFLDQGLSWVSDLRKTMVH